jgi:DNA-binding MarR family transcriptional regulator
MVPVVTELMAKGLLERAPADGRSHSLYLTEEGAVLLRKINKVALTHEEFFFGDVPDNLREILMQAFRALRAKAELWEKPALQPAGRGNNK